MANMSTNVQRSWDKLLAGDNSPSLACVSQFREWMLSDLLKVSRLLQFPMEEAHDNRVRHYLLTAPIDLFAVQRIAWEEFAVSLTHRPPTFNPEALWQWAELSLWKLLVPVIPDEACDNGAGCPYAAVLGDKVLIAWSKSEERGNPKQASLLLVDPSGQSWKKPSTFPSL